MEKPDRAHLSGFVFFLCIYPCALSVTWMTQSPEKPCQCKVTLSFWISQTIRTTCRQTSKFSITYPYSSDVESSTEELHNLISRLIRICPEDASRYGRHDAGNSKLYSDLFNDVVCYVPERKKWYVYDGSRWRPDTENTEVMKRCRLAANALMSYTVQNVKDEHSRTDFMKHISKWQQLKYREGNRSPVRKSGRQRYR